MSLIFRNGEPHDDVGGYIVSQGPLILEILIGSRRGFNHVCYR